LAAKANARSVDRQAAAGAPFSIALVDVCSPFQKVSIWQSHDVLECSLYPFGFPFLAVRKSEYAEYMMSTKNFTMGDGTSGGATLQDIVAAYDVRGDAGLDSYRGCAALLHSELNGSPVAPAMGFETRAVEAPWHLRVTVSLTRTACKVSAEALVRVTRVHALSKRFGGPFPERIGVGRTRQADVSLRAPSISKYHAYFTRDEQKNRWHLVDARSRNGTWVDDRRLEPGESAAVEDGARVLLGEESFLFFSADGFHNLLKVLARPNKQ
jgi:hypothetical protein